MPKVRNFRNNFVEVDYNRFENDVYWGRPSLAIGADSFNDVLNLQYKIKVFNSVKNLTHNTVLEVGWTILPMLILVIIALPSMRLLYFMENPLSALLLTYDTAVTIIGHQWFWSYEHIKPEALNITDTYLFNDFSSLVDESENVHAIGKTKFQSYDSYMLACDEVVAEKGLRLLDVDKPLYVSQSTRLRLFITSVDVIHSWAIPSLGIKTDAVPGRLSLVSTFIKNSGIFYGQCSEICGIGHGFMPIKLICV